MWGKNDSKSLQRIFGECDSGSKFNVCIVFRVPTVFSQKKKKEGKKKPEKVFIINEINTNHKNTKSKTNYIYLIPYGLHPVF